MKIINNAVIVMVIAVTASNTFAEEVVIKPSKSTRNEIYPFTFKTGNDGYIFLLGPESTNKVVITVNKMIASGTISDPVTVYCNAAKYRVQPGASLSCYGHFADISSFSIAPDEVKNGSEGTYTYVPLQK